MSEELKTRLTDEQIADLEDNMPLADLVGAHEDHRLKVISDEIVLTYSLNPSFSLDLIGLTMMTGTTPDAGDFGSGGANLMDGDFTNQAAATVVNQYAGVAFGSICRIDEYRIRGDAGNSGLLGRFKLQYEDEYGAFVDHVLDIIPVQTDVWGEYVSMTPVICKGVRLVCTTYNANSRFFKEFEVRGLKLE